MRRRPWESRYMEQKERLREPMTWYPIPAFLSFLFVMLFTTHIVLGTSPRVGHHAELIQFGEESAPSTAMWISMVIIDDDVVVTTQDRRIFRWPHNVRGAEDIKEFTSYLKTKADEEIITAAISGTAFETQTKLTFAVDQRLKYRHFRPVLFAMAQAGISNYAFETRIASAE